MCHVDHPCILLPKEKTQVRSAPEENRTSKPCFIEAKDIQVRYGNNYAIQGVDLNLHPGEIAVLMGSNGAGKTTLLRSLIGLIPLESGSSALAERKLRVGP